MAENSAIEWTDHTFNPWTGCTRVGPGCDNCYAESWSKRAGDRVGKWGPGAQRVRTTAANWSLPVKWNRQAAVAQAGWAEGVKLYGSEAAALAAGNIKPRRPRVFCASLADVFDNEVPEHWRWDLFRLIAATPHLDWLLLSKRIGNAASMLNSAAAAAANEFVGALEWDRSPWPNVWLGATVVNQAEADRDIPKLLTVPARVRFLSIEPMLGPVEIWRYLSRHCERHPPPLDTDGKCEICEGRGIWSIGDQLDESEKAPIRPGLDWIICGGESGPKARPMHPDWARTLRDQCAAAGVPFLFKQWGEWVPADDDIEGGIVPVSEICGDIPYPEGRRVRTEWLSPNGSNVGHSFARMGKQAAGRLLDGVVHNGFPEATHA
jgi:protein gp37